ncbi:hypothetical protein M408DRAFT_46864, partial [Serendipita vermifera MAFF 305830]
IVIDAGGPCGISQLEILKDAMERLANYANEGSPQTIKRPWEVFAMIGGTGTGGLIAILLVVLKMTAGEALETFTDLVNKVFKDADRNPDKQTERLKQWIRNVLTKYEVVPGTKLVSPNGTGPACKLFIPVFDRGNIGSPIILTNYVDRQSPPTSFTVAEAMLATCASPPVFSPAKVVKDFSAVEYVAADHGFSNPTRAIIDGAHRFFGGETPIICFLSIGCGHPGVNTVPGNSHISSQVAFLERAATDCERTAQEVASQMRKLTFYHRLSVAYGMEAAEYRLWKEPEDMVAQTRNYLTDEEVAKAMNQCVTTLNDGAGLTTLEYLGMFSTVFFVDGSSEETFKNDLIHHVRSLGGAQSQMSFQESMKFLSLPSMGGERLLVIDNADDPKVEISRFLPKWKRGTVILTSRNATHGQLAPYSH